MIANPKTEDKMSIDMLSTDSGHLSADLSFFSNETQRQHSYSSELIPDLDSDEWLQGFGSLQSYCNDVIGLDPYNEPEFALEVMDKGVGPQRQSDIQEINPYLDSSAFLSPESIEPNSPQKSDGFVDHLEQELDLMTDFDVEALNNTSAMSILEEILSSAQPSDCDESSNPCFDDLNIQCVTEIPKVDEMVENTSRETKRPKKQNKRKAVEMDSDLPKEKPKANKRSKTNVSEKKERKRRQNKCAANRYRLKKRAEVDTIGDLMDQYSSDNQSLKNELQKLQMEFKVLFPLAKAAFASVANKALQLQMLDIRVLNHNLMD